MPAPVLADAGFELRIRGRGWPQIAGWDVDSDFLPEETLKLEIESAAALLLPYSYYFQSGVAVRAIESSLPVVGRRHDFLEAMLGSFISRTGGFE